MMVCIYLSNDCGRPLSPSLNIAPRSDWKAAVFLAIADICYDQDSRGARPTEVKTISCMCQEYAQMTYGNAKLHFA